MSRPRLVSLEFTVPDLGPGLALFAGVLGLEVLGPERHTVLDAEVAQVVDGDVVITLIHPTDTGSGVPHSLPEPRLSQLNFAAPGEDLAGIRSRLESAGAAVVDRGGLFLVDPEMVKGMLGADAALVFTPEDPGVGADGR